MGPIGIGNCRYTVLSTVGTTSINQGVTLNTAAPFNYGNLVTQNSVYYGFQVVNVGTSFACTVYDIYAAGSNAQALSTNTLANGTGTAFQFFGPGPSPVGVRVQGSLVAVTAGTAGAINLFWD